MAQAEAEAVDKEEQEIKHREQAIAVAHFAQEGVSLSSFPSSSSSFSTFSSSSASLSSQECHDADSTFSIASDSNFAQFSPLMSGEKKGKNESRVGEGEERKRGGRERRK